VLKWLYFWNQPSQKVIFETHDYFFDLSKRVDIGRYGRKKKSNIENKYFKYTDAIIGSNDYQAELYSQHFPEKPVQSFPTGLIEIHKTNSNRNLKVAYIGTLEPRLGMDRVMALIEHLSKEIQMVIIGGRGAKDINQFRSLFPGNSLPENVHVTGWLKKKELVEVLKDIKLGLLPLYSDQNKFALPLKIFDYFAFGIPVISSKLPAIEKIIIEGETGFYVDWENPAEVAKLIERMVFDDDLWSDLSNEVYAKAEELTWSRRAKDQVEFFTKLTKQDV
jgi:glycosyltransferase involved in cell wall biosynthesis